MLVLSRRMGERVTIFTPAGEKIEVMIVSVDGGRVRLGFNAPTDCPIYRAELLASGAVEAPPKPTPQPEAKRT